MERDDVHQRTINFVRSLTDLSEDEVKAKFGKEIEALTIVVGKPIPEPGKTDPEA